MPGFATRQKQSPPMPVMWGSTTASVAAAATAASAAVPPALRVSMATWLASGCEVAAMPSQAKTADRPGLWKSRCIGSDQPDRRHARDGGRLHFGFRLQDLTAAIHARLEVDVVGTAQFAGIL